jgi:hypothetical protein
MVTLSDISKATGAKPRSVQLWADAGVIIPEPGTDREGSGRHREFSKSEVIIACIVAPFAADKMSIGGLLGLARVVRDHWLDKNTKALDDAINGIGNNFLLVASGRIDPVKYVTDGGEPELMTHMIGLIDDDESHHPFGEFMAGFTQDFPMVSILSLYKVLKPLKAMKF